MSEVDKTKSNVLNVFSNISPKYDFMNTFLTFGIEKFWRRQTIKALNLFKGAKVLDLACGTGTSSYYIYKAGAIVTGIDFSIDMLATAEIRYPHIQFFQGDATSLFCESNEFDRINISFGIRNIQNYKTALAECYRVLKPGGSLVITEMSHPLTFKKPYEFYLKNIMPIFAKYLSSSPESYKYLNDTIISWLSQKELAYEMHLAGFKNVEYKNMTDGIAAIHRAQK